MSAADHTIFDWAHSALQCVLGIASFLFLLALSPAHSRVAFRQLHDYIQQWTYPRRVETSSSTARDVLTPKRLTSHIDARRIKFTMSEALSFVPIFRHWVITVVRESRPDMHSLCNCMISLCLFIQLLITSCRYHVDPSLVERTYALFFSLFIENFGEEHTTPKFHYLIHIPRIMLRFGWAMNCMVAERKHKTIKAFADAIDNPYRLARSCMRETICVQMSTLEMSDWLDLSPHIESRRRCTGALKTWVEAEFGIGATVCTSTSARLNEYERCACGDVVVFKTDGSDDICVGRVWYLLDVDGTPFCVVDRFDCITYCTDFSEWAVLGNPCVLLFCEVLDVCIHLFTNAATQCRILHSYALRSDAY